MALTATKEINVDESRLGPLMKFPVSPVETKKKLLTVHETVECRRLHLMETKNGKSIRIKSWGTKHTELIMEAGEAPRCDSSEELVAIILG